jgi:hypothetical protein
MASDPSNFLDAARTSFCSRPFEATPGVFVRCQSRRRAVCPSCAELHRGDWTRIARSGIYDADGNAVVGHRFHFVTLSAPSFGQVHRVPKPKDRRPPSRCGCGEFHGSDEHDLRGLPLDLDSYDVSGQVSWHLALGRLWNSSVSAMRDIAPDLEFFVVREVQARMAMHLHVIIRVPAAFHVAADELGRAARAATAAHPVTGEVVEWGQRGVQDREILAIHQDADSAMPSESKAAGRVIRYVSKALGYSLKDVVPGGSDTLPSPERAAFIARLRHAARDVVRCVRCEGRPRDCEARAHDSLGFAGHTVSVSRRTSARPGWSFSALTRTRLREERLAWVQANTSDRTGASADDFSVLIARWIQTELTTRIHDAARATYARAPGR